MDDLKGQKVLKVKKRDKKLLRSAGALINIEINGCLKYKSLKKIVFSEADEDELYFLI